MAQQPQQQRQVIDPDNIPEILCDGRFNFHPHGVLATLTFTCERAEPNDLFGGTVNVRDVVRARITMTLNSMVALRDLLSRVIQTPSGAPAAGGSTHH